MGNIVELAGSERKEDNTELMVQAFVKGENKKLL